jgi:succinyl-diaminopimelate desuccinylase
MVPKIPRIEPRLADRVLAQVAHDDVLGLLRELVQIPTVNPPGDVRPVIDVCGRKLESEGFEIQVASVQPEKPNLIARLIRGDGPTLLYNAHADVVPTGEASAWTHPPFGAGLVGGRVYGRGTADDKGSIVAQVIGAIALARSGVPLHGTLVVNTVADEEIGGDLGTRFIVERGDVLPDFVVVGEATENRIAIGERGSVGTRVTVHGRAAHAALPWEGVNAIEAMAGVIDMLQNEHWPILVRRTHRYLPPSSATITMIEGGVKSNVVPDRCSIFIDSRIIPGETPDQIRSEISEVAARALSSFPGTRLTVEPAGWEAREASLSSPDSPVVQAMVAANGHLGLRTDLTGFSMTTDARFFIAKGIPTVIYGPGDPQILHKPDEWIGVDSVVEAARAYALTGLAMLGGLDQGNG